MSLLILKTINLTLIFEGLKLLQRYTQIHTFLCKQLRVMCHCQINHGKEREIDLP